MFSTRFVDCKPMITTSMSQHNVIQVDVDSLWQYLARFAKVSLNIPSLHMTMAMHKLLVGLCLRKFLNTLYADPLANVDNFLFLSCFRTHLPPLSK